MVKVRITGKGIYGRDGELAIGSIVDLKEEPVHWKGRYTIVSGKSGKRDMVVNPDLDDR